MRLSRRYRVLFVLLLGSVAQARALDPTEARILGAVESGREEALALLEETVNIRSATENHAGVRAVGAVLARELAELGFTVRWIDLPVGVARAGHLVAERQGGTGKRILLIGHLDTVLEGEAYRREGNLAYGSGTADMKGGNLVIVEALRAMHAAGVLEGRSIRVVFTGDEEDPGLPHEQSRQALFAAAEASDVALGFEGASEGMGVIGRRGIGTWRLSVAGRQAHSSGIFREEQGDGAIFEAARILEGFREELREPYLSFNPAVVVGGTEVSYDEAAKSGTARGKTNVIPREVQVEGDLRFLTPEQWDSARERMEYIVSTGLPHTSASIRFVREYPSMAPTERNRELLELFDEVSRDLGTGPVEAQDPAERGAGDISFVCEDGRLACLDGLGALGEHAHAPGEYLEVEALFGQVRRTSLLLYRLGR